MFDRILSASERGVGKGKLYAQMHRTGQDIHLEKVASTKKREGKIKSFKVDRKSGKLRVEKKDVWYTVQNVQHLLQIAES